MKKLLIPLLLFSSIIEVHAQADPYHNTSGATKTPVTRTIESFGAIANDGIDDSQAFMEAAAWFSNIGATNIDYSVHYGILQLGSGTYLVGKQVTDSNSNAMCAYGAVFADIDGLIIQGTGANATKVKILPGAYFGYFQKGSVTPAYGNDPNGNPDTNSRCHLPYSCANPNAYNVGPGTVITFSGSSKNILIQNLEMDGSSDTYHVGNPSQPNGDYNVAVGYGINTSAIQYLSLNNLYIHNFGEDGIRIDGNEVAAANGRWNVTIDGVTSYWNGRQALSWTAGRNMRVRNSNFGYTRFAEGHYDTDPGISGHIQGLSPVPGSPGANVDIEPEPYDDGTPRWIRNGLFENCKMLGNLGPSASLTISLDADSIIFNNCEIKGYNNIDPSLPGGWAGIGLSDVHNRNFTFNQCDIVGTINFIKSDWMRKYVLPDSGLTKFVNCSIASNMSANYVGDYALIAAYDRCLFNNCTIIQKNQRPLFDMQNVNLNENTIPNPDNYTTLNNCTIQSFYSSPPQALDLRGRMYGLRFTGNTNWARNVTTSSSYDGQHIFFENGILNGSSQYSPMNVFTFPNINIFEGTLPQGSWLLDPTADVHAYERPVIIGETPCEYLQVYIGEGNNIGFSLFRNEARPLYIGEGVTVTVRNGSSMVLSGDIYLAGKIVVEPSAYLKFATAMPYSTAYTPGAAPTIHLLGNTSAANINSHIVLQPGASITTGNIPGIWTASSAQPNYVAHSLRSSLMAPNAYLRSEVAAYRANYDNPAMQCKQCYKDTTSYAGYMCYPRMDNLHPFKGIADADFYFPSDDDSGIEIYPNPANDKVNIILDGIHKASDIQLLDINGRLLYRTSSKEGNEVEISLSKYPQGTYLVRISNEDNTVIKKVVKVN